MRILHLHHRYWPGVGGGEIYFHEFSARLVADGHDVTVATSDALAPTAYWDPKAARLSELTAEHDGVHIRRFPLRHLPGSPLAYSLWRYHVFLRLTRILPVERSLRLSRYTPWVPSLWQWVAETPERFDLIAAMSVLYEPFVAAGQALAHRLNVPFVVYPLTHLGAAARPGSDQVGRYYTMKHQHELVRRAERVITITGGERDYYVSRGLQRERFAVASPGVDPAALPVGDGDRFRQKHKIAGPLVAFVASLTPDKGCNALVEAVARLWTRGVNVELALAGTRLAAFDNFMAAQPEAVRNRVRVLGVVDDAEKQDLLAAASLFAMPSRTDSFGIAYLEAWLAGLPVIGARAWTMDDVIADGVDGLLVPYNDAVALSDAIAALLADPARRAAMGAAGRAKTVSRYTWDNAYQSVLSTYRELVPGA